MKLKFIINKEGKKSYTLKDNINNQQSSQAHYKFVKVKNPMARP